MNFLMKFDEDGQDGATGVRAQRFAGTPLRGVPAAVRGAVRGDAEGTARRRARQPGAITGLYRSAILLRA
ncbi:hypothetical protein DUI70_4601 [Streptomyces albus]|nr:hypothetical protein DUI70_4601 [Streptomyces albus]